MNRMSRMSPNRAGHAREMKFVKLLEMLVTVVVSALVISGVAIGVTTSLLTRSNA
jgi:hypothetical protein